MKPIETKYNGYRFRSRLEARWAVFFNAMGIKWEYEKEGYNLGKAGYYLPDFWFPELKCWFEVKPVYEKYNEKARELANQSYPVIMCMGNIGEEVMELYCNDTNDNGGGGYSQWKGQLINVVGYSKTSFVVNTYYHDLLDKDWNRLDFIFDNQNIFSDHYESKCYEKARSSRFEFGSK